MRGPIARLVALAGLAAGAAWGQLTVTCVPAGLPQLVGTPVSVTCTASGGTGPYTWSIGAGTLPPGLTQNTGSGGIAGTLMDPAGPYGFMVTATDTVPPNATGGQAYSGTTVDPLTVNCVTNTRPVEVGVAYSSTCTAAGGTQPYSWTLGGAAVPPGMSITPTGNPAMVALLPSSPMPGYGYYVAVSDSSVPLQFQHSASFNGTIVPAVAITTASSLPPAAVNSPYSLLFAATGGYRIYSWSASGLPGWLTLNTDGVLTGTPTSTGPVSFNVSVTDSVGGVSTGPFTLTVNPALTITTTSPLPSAVVGTNYTQTFAATGGAGSPYTWSATGLPTWLSLSAGGVLTGVPPSSAVNAGFAVTVRDSSNNFTTQPFVLPVTLAITTTSRLPSATIGAAYNQTFAAGGGGGGYTWSASGLPSWLTLTTAGALTGVPPSSAVNANFTVKVTDTAGASVTASFILPVTLTIATTSPLPAATVNTPYSQTLAAQGGAGGYTWSATGLPSWLTLNSAGGLSGNPPSSAVDASFTAKVTDSAGASATATITVPVTLTITTTSPLPAATPGSPYSQTFAAVGGAGGYMWSATGLPSWLILSTAGVLTGTPTASGPVNFNVTVKDSSGTIDTGPFTLPVNAAPLAISTTSPLANGTTGVAYSQTLAGTGGVPPYTWSVTAGTLPNNLGLNAGSGVISGTPTVAGTFTFTIQLSASGTAPVTKQFTITIATGLTITTTSPLPAATTGSAYVQTFAAVGGTGGYSWSATGLPTWLTLSTSGVLSGTPPASGPVNFNVTVKDSSGSPSTGPFTLPVNAAGLAITTNSALAGGTIGVAYSHTLAGTGGVPPYTWSVTAGSLPNSLGLNGASGVISGTPTAAGTLTFTIQLSDSASTTPVTRQFTITIASGLTITTAPSLPNATAGVAYSQTLQAVGGTAPYTWSIVQGALPAPLSLNPSTGAITGVPAAAGTSTFTIQVTDSHAVTSSKAFTLTVVGGLSIATASLPNGTVGVAYSQTIAASGGAAPYSWSIVAGSSPAGTALNPTSGTLSGTPTSSASFTFTVQVTDSSSNTASKPFTVVIASGVIISTAPALPTGSVGMAYSQPLAASGGTPPYSWAIASGSLPAGLALSAAGVISGTPTATATATFAIQATDSTGVKGSKTFTLSIVSTPAISTTSPLPGGEIGVLYSQTLTAVGGAPPYTWSVSANALPAGLTLSAAGTIGGTPSAAGTFTFTAQITDSNSVSVTKSLVIAVAVRVGITTPATLNGGSVAAAYSQTLAATGGLPPYSWSVVSGTLPSGVTLSGAGVIAGSPTAPGTFTFTVRVTDSAAVTASQQFTITVATGLIISSAATLPGAVVGAAYSQTLRAAGGTAPYTWTLVTGSLPMGLSLAGSGVISGTPTAFGTSSFTAQVTDSASHQTSKQMSITVEVQPSITTSSLPNGATGVAYSQALAASGGTPPYSWSISSGTLPTGLALSAAGAITGTLSAAGVFTFTVQFTDSFSVTAAKQLSLTVVATLSISTAASLPAGVVASSYSQTLTVVGGTPPYTWTLTSGSLPAGLALGSAGTIAGTPTATGTSTFTLQVKGTPAATASRQFTLVIVAGLTISTAATLPGATAGTAYSQPLTAAGGLPPYQWTIVKGALPAGLALNASSGIISGTPTKGGNFTITVQVTDSTPINVSQSFTLAVAQPPAPASSFAGLPSTASPMQQLTGGLSLAAAYPLDISGELTLTFQPDAVYLADDPSIQFSTGGRTLPFTIPHGDTTAPSFSLQTGSVAGTITLSVTWQAGGVTFAERAGLSPTIQIARVAPVITAVTASTTSTGLQVLVTGYSNTREVTQAVVQFTAAAGQSLQTASVTVPLTDAANTWFEGAASDQYGGQFILTLPFTVTGGASGAIGSVSVTLTNTIGTSNSTVSEP